MRSMVLAPLLVHRYIPKWKYEKNCEPHQTHKKKNDHHRGLSVTLSLQFLRITLYAHLRYCLTGEGLTFLV